MNKECSINNVPLLSRVLTLIFDSLFPLQFFVLSMTFLLFGENWTIQITIIIFIVMFISIWVLDQIILPRKTGYTFIRYLFGFKIKYIKTNQKIPFLNLFGRGITILILESIITSLITLIIILIRKDKRAIHEIVSGTYGKMVSKPKYLLIMFFLIPFVIISYCGGVHTMCIMFDKIYIKPSINKMIENINFRKIVQTEKEFLKLIGSKENSLNMYEKTLTNFKIEPIIEKKSNFDSFDFFYNNLTEINIIKKVYCQKILTLSDPYPFFSPMDSYNNILFRIFAIAASTRRADKNYTYCTKDNKVYNYMKFKSKKGFLESYEVFEANLSKSALTLHYNTP